MTQLQQTTVTSKRCARCKEHLSLEMFQSFKHSKNGKVYYQSKCKPCHTTYNRELRARDTTKRHGYKLKHKYGMTVQDYDALMEKQGGVCAICKNPETSRHSKSKEVQRLAVDHCHESGKIRGLLCQACNTALGKFNDNLSTLESAILYLKENG